MNDGDVDEDASVGVMKIDVGALPIFVEITRLGLRSDAGVVEGGDKEVTDEIVAEGGGAALEDGTGEEVIDVILEGLFADAEGREPSGGWKRETKHGGEAEGVVV